LKPVFTPKNIVDLFKRNIALFDSSNDIKSLIGSMIAVEMISNPEICVENVTRRIEWIAKRIENKVKTKNEQALLAHLTLELYGDEEIKPYLKLVAIENYNDPKSNHIGYVANGGIGFPSLLALVYVAVAKRLGINAYGMALPGWFYIGIKSGNKILYINPGDGMETTTEEIKAKVKVNVGEVLINLEPISNKYWITRILQNALRIYVDNKQAEYTTMILELEYLLWPEEYHLIRDLGLICARSEKLKPHSHSILKEYIELINEKGIKDERSGDIVEMIEILK